MLGGLLVRYVRVVKVSEGESQTEEQPPPPPARALTTSPLANSQMPLFTVWKVKVKARESLQLSKYKISERYKNEKF